MLLKGLILKLFNFGQTFLKNALFAIKENTGDKITILEKESDTAIVISNNGQKYCESQDKIFDKFYTTKDKGLDLA